MKPYLFSKFFKKLSFVKIGLACFIFLIAVSFFYFRLDQYLNFDFIKSHSQNLIDFYKQHPIATMALFFSVYVLVSIMALPGAAILTIVSGYLFGLFLGVAIVSLASTIGATCSFLISRFLFRDWIQSRWGSKLAVINKGVQKDGNFYLLSLRLIPAFPFFLVNLLMGLTPFKVMPFALVSQLGMLPATIIYVNVGTHFSQIDSLQGILSFKIIASFLLLASFPWIVKSALLFYKKTKKIK